jgi:hypothetical protein
MRDELEGGGSEESGSGRYFMKLSTKQKNFRKSSDKEASYTYIINRGGTKT